MELTIYLLKRKDFYNKIKILYSLWGVQPNLEKNKISHLSIFMKWKKKKNKKKTPCIHPLGPWDE